MNKKIIIIINDLGVGGAQRQAIDDINELLRKGEEVILVTLKPEKKESSLKESCNISEQQWQRFYFNNLYDFPKWKALISFLKSEKPDLVITHLWFSNTIGRVASKIAGLKNVVIFVQNVYDNVKTWKQFLIDRILQYFYPNIIVVSEAVKKSVIKHGIKPSKIEVLPNTINTSKFKVAKQSSIRKDYELGDEFLFLFVGRLINQKGVDILLKAFSNLNQGILLIAGEGKDKEKFEKMTLDLGISERVIFLGVRNDIPELLKTADCFVMPSRWEGLPIALMEAMASGSAIITSNFDSAIELIKDNKSGLIIPIEDIQSTTKAMTKIMTDSDLRKNLQNGAIEKSKSFSIKRHTKELLKFVK